MRSAGTNPAQSPVRAAKGRGLPTAILGFAVCFCLIALGVAATGLWQAREDALAAADRELRNVVGGLVDDVQRTVDLYDGLLRDVAAAAGGEGAGGRRLGLDRIDLLPEAGGVVVLDERGRIVDEAPARPAGGDCCSEAPEFVALRDRAEPGLLVSGPQFAIDAPTDAHIAMWRRIEGRDAEFLGAATASMRIAYLRGRFRALDLGAGGSVAILTADGYVIARRPSSDGGGEVLRQMPLPFAEEEISPAVTTAVRPSPLDGTARLFALSRVGNLPLVVAAGLPVTDIYRRADARAAMVGGAVLALAAAFLAVAAALRHTMVRRADAENLIDKIAVTDALTNLANQRRFDEVLSAEWRRGARNRLPLAVLIVQVDNFASTRNRFGKATGDTVLRGVARAIAQSIHRPGDLAARFGEEEFAVLLPETGSDGALMLAERIRARAAELDAGVKLRALRVTVSVGVGWGYPDRGTEPEDLVASAERALSLAKAAGLNRAARVALGQENAAVLARS